MAANSYTLVDTLGFLEITGVTGTPVEDVSYSIQKNNILKLSVDTATNSIGIATLDNTNYWFLFSELIDPDTSVPYISLSAAFAGIQAIANSTSASYPTNFFSTKTTLGLVRLQILPTAGAGWVTIKSASGNAGLITVGTVTTVAGSGFELAAEEVITIETDNLSDIYLISATNNQVFYIIGSTK